jgi:transcriptional regulator with XRE-family HTH domain
MSKPFKNLIEKMSPERQERIKRKAKNLKTQMALGELRRALELTQEQVAGSLNMNQAAISKFEHQSDIYIGTLRKILSAMGAELRIIAHFPDSDVVIDQFTDLQKSTKTNCTGQAKRNKMHKGTGELNMESRKRERIEGGYHGTGKLF